ncbi:MAG: hypothetical protein HeimC2_24110 [Candidatus Heimdallarchaeota archaeon LC_2]|nr:MAG: hypothetical protein HeimC2_24110 [Candidatus Heimdallarchaeota archaeon LC_2]
MDNKVISVIFDLETITEEFIKKIIKYLKQILENENLNLDFISILDIGLDEVYYQKFLGTKSSPSMRSVNLKTEYVISRELIDKILIQVFNEMKTNLEEFHIKYSNAVQHEKSKLIRYDWVISLVSIRYIQTISRSKNKDISLLFDSEIYKEIFEKVCKLWIENVSEITVIYPIFNIDFNGEDFKIPYKNEFISELNFYLGTDNNLNDLGKKFSDSILFSEFGLSNDWILSCTGWLECKIKLSRFDDDYKETPDSEKIENFFLLLGFQDVVVKKVYLISDYSLTGVEYDSDTNTTYSVSPVSEYKSVSKRKEFPSWMIRRVDNHRRGINMDFSNKKVRVENQDLELDNYIKDFITKFLSYKELKPVIRSILYKFHRMMTLKDVESIIIEASIILETLFIPNQSDVTKQLQRNFTWFLGDTWEERILLLDLITIIYNIRSKIAHGGSYQEMEKLIAERFVIMTEREYSEISKFDKASIERKRARGWKISEGYYNIIKLCTETVRLCILKMIELTHNEISFLEVTDLNGLLDNYIIFPQPITQLFPSNFIFDKQKTDYFEMVKDRTSTKAMRKLFFRV